MADTKISALAAVASVADAQEFAVNDAGTSKKATAQQIAGLLFARIAGASGASGGYLTLQRLTANSADVTTTALSAAIMTTTGLGAGTWKFKYTLICQCASATRPTHVAAQAARERAKARAAAAGPKVAEARAPGGHVIPIRPDTRPAPRAPATSPTEVYAQAEPTPGGVREVLARSGAVPAPEARRAEAAGQARRVWSLGGEVTPEPRASPELNDDAQRRLTGSVKDVVSLGGGAGVSGIARFADGRFGVWKPAALEQVHRRSIPAGMQWVREVAAYDLAREAGLTDLVPVTVAARIKATHGSLQAWVDGEAPDTLPRDDRVGRSWFDAQRGYAFDVVTGNTDRHSSNWLVAKGKLQLIDHGLAFPNRNELMRSLLLRYGQTASDAPNAVRIAPSVRLLGIPDEVKAPWRDVQRRWDEVQRKLLGRGLEPAAVALTKRRLNAFLRADRWGDVVGEEEVARFQAVHAGVSVTRTP